MLRDLLNPRHLLPTLATGLITGIFGVIFSISYGVLLFSGSMTPFLGRGIGFILVGSAVIAVTASLTSSYPGVVSTPQDGPIAVLSLISAAMASSMASSPPQATFITVIATLMVSGLAVGIVMIALGWFKVGELVRFIPYPVIGGFLAGTGWLLFTGGLGVMVEIAPDRLPISYIVRFEHADQWLPGLVFAFILLLALRRYSHFLIMPGLLLAAMVIFYAYHALMGRSVEDIRAMGLLLGPFPSGSLWSPLTPAEFAQIDWGQILDQSVNIMTIVIVSTIALLLNASGLEMATKKDISLNRELLSAGISNVLTGFAGGIAGYPTLSETILGYRLKANSRLIGIILALFLVVVLFIGSSVLTFFPKPILGGLIMYIGLGFLVEWLYDGWFKLPRAEYIMIPIIITVIALVGYLEGVVVGIIMTVILFVVNYSRINVVRHTMTGETRHSTIIRSERQNSVLAEHGSQIYLLELQGYIFFGTANGLLDRIRQYVTQTPVAERFIILDFRRVLELDLSALMSLVKLRDFAEAQKAVLVVANASEPIRKEFRRGGLAEDAHFRLFDDIDRALEWCENEILRTAGAAETAASSSLLEALGQAFPHIEDAARLTAYLVREELSPGTYLARQGDIARELYYVESGQLSIQLGSDSGQATRIRTITAGAIVGEVATYLGTPRTASIVVDEPSVVYRLSADAMKAMRDQDPLAAAIFHEFMAQIIAERLVDTTQALEAMMK